MTRTTVLRPFSEPVLAESETWIRAHAPPPPVATVSTFQSRFRTGLRARGTGTGARGPGQGGKIASWLFIDARTQ
jgi:hypothetical protein